MINPMGILSARFTWYAITAWHSWWTLLDTFYSAGFQDAKLSGFSSCFPGYAVSVFFPGFSSASETIRVVTTQILLSIDIHSFGELTQFLNFKYHQYTRLPNLYLWSPLLNFKCLCIITTCTQYVQNWIPNHSPQTYHICYFLHLNFWQLSISGCWDQQHWVILNSPLLSFLVLFTMKSCWLYHQSVLRIRPLLTTSITANLSQDMIFPHLDYCNCHQNDLPDSTLDYLTSILSIAARVVLLKCELDHVSPRPGILQRLHISLTGKASPHNGLKAPHGLPSLICLIPSFSIFPFTCCSSHFGLIFCRTQWEHSCLKDFELVVSSGAFYSQIPTWITHSSPSSLCSSYVFSIRPALTTFLK